MSRARIFLADDHAMLLAAFGKLLEDDYDIVGTATDGVELVQRAPALEPDVIVSDIAMPNLNGIDAFQQVREKLPDTKVIFLTVNQDPIVASQAIAEGASGFLLKKSAASELLIAIESALSGQTYITPLIAGAVLGVSRRGETEPAITPRQRQVLQLLAEGRSMKEIATLMDIKARTVAHHKYTMMESLGIETSAELISYALKKGLLST